MNRDRNQPNDRQSNAEPRRTGDDSRWRIPPQFTAAQAAAGKTAYNSNCAVCHGSTMTNGTFGTPLAGEYFKNAWFGRTVSRVLRPRAQDHAAGRSRFAAEGNLRRYRRLHTRIQWIQGGQHRASCRRRRARQNGYSVGHMRAAAAMGDCSRTFFA